MLYVNEKIGVIDLVMNPKNPDVLYAAAYDKQRLPWQMVNGGPDSGIYKTTDGGTHLDEAQRRAADRAASAGSGSTSSTKNPDILYAIIENENPRTGRRRCAAPPAGRGGAAATYRRRGLPHGQRRAVAGPR